ncbi:hypothetical protein EI74_0433 [Mycoplasma testudineum]|uniref:Peptidase S8/S53 domain-containing protein n=1 Tax=Mycoplasma testudineum TaxID=244584 RepID=A0A4R6IH57_9MOLU|nr:S8 family serine peptidase [Mycoplasma testudineum]OYD26821.1 hypothetical protein CG473_01785 [Mycoplasma testudineum]TDO20355.1 hypothetical protein EI74_0433 [Mycoplasma testudineum]
MKKKNIIKKLLNIGLLASLPVTFFALSSNHLNTVIHRVKNENNTNEKANWNDFSIKNGYSLSYKDTEIISESSLVDYEWVDEYEQTDDITYLFSDENQRLDFIEKVNIKIRKLLDTNVVSLYESKYSGIVVYSFKNKSDFEINLKLINDISNNYDSIVNKFIDLKENNLHEIVSTAEVMPYYTLFQDNPWDWRNDPGSSWDWEKIEINRFVEKNKLSNFEMVDKFQVFGLDDNYINKFNYKHHKDIKRVGMIEWWGTPVNEYRLFKNKINLHYLYSWDQRYSDNQTYNDLINENDKDGHILKGHKFLGIDATIFEPAIYNIVNRTRLGLSHATAVASIIMGAESTIWNGDIYATSLKNSYRVMPSYDTLINNGIKLINNSWGFKKKIDKTIFFDKFANIIDRMVYFNRDLTIVNAAGNDANLDGGIYKYIDSYNSSMNSIIVGAIEQNYLGDENRPLENMYFSEISREDYDDDTKKTLQLFNCCCPRN